MAMAAMQRSASNHHLDSQGNEFTPMMRYDLLARGQVHDIQVEHHGGAWRLLVDGEVAAGKKHNKTNPLTAAKHRIVFHIRTNLADGLVQCAMTATWSVKSSKWNYAMELNGKPVEPSWEKKTGETGREPIEMFGPPLAKKEENPVVAAPAAVPAPTPAPPPPPEPVQDAVPAQERPAFPMKEASEELTAYMQQPEAVQALPDYMMRPPDSDHGLSSILEASGMEALAYDECQEVQLKDTQPCCGYGARCFS